MDGRREIVFLLTGRFEQGEPHLELLPEHRPRLDLVLGVLYCRGLRWLEDEGEGLFIYSRSLEPGPGLGVILGQVWPGPSWCLRYCAWGLSLAWARLGSARIGARTRQTWSLEPGPGLDMVGGHRDVCDRRLVDLSVPHGLLHGVQGALVQAGAYHLDPRLEVVVGRSQTREALSLEPGPDLDMICAHRDVVDRRPGTASLGAHRNVGDCRLVHLSVPHGFLHGV